MVIHLTDFFSGWQFNGRVKLSEGQLAQGAVVGRMIGSRLGMGGNCPGGIVLAAVSWGIIVRGSIVQGRGNYRVPSKGMCSLKFIHSHPPHFCF